MPDSEAQSTSNGIGTLADPNYYNYAWNDPSFSNRGRRYENRLKKWVYVGDVFLRSVDPAMGTMDSAGVIHDLIDELTKGNLSARPAKWSDLVIGSTGTGSTLRIETPR